MEPARLSRRIAMLAVVALALTACVSNTADGGSTIAVTSTDDACQVAVNTAKSGTLSFDVKNQGTQVTEFYLMAEDGLAVIGEVEDVAPGSSRTMTVTVPPGEYVTLCKPGMVGEGVGRASFTVTGE